MEDTSPNYAYSLWLKRPKEEAYIYVRLRIVTLFNILKLTNSVLYTMHIIEHEFFCKTRSVF